MKVRMNLKINNCDKFIDEVIEKYHFDRKNKPELTEIYNNLMDCVKPLAAYKINQKVTGIKIIDDCQAAVVCMTMGKGPDILKEAYTKNKELDKAYMMDCIANELLMKMYVEFNNMYARFHRRYVKSAFSSLSQTEKDAVTCVINELKGSGEGVIILSRLSEKVGITRSVIVNALRKMESADVIVTKSSGVKGTYIKVLNDSLYEEMNSDIDVV